MKKFALLVLVVLISNGVNPLEESSSEEHTKKIPVESLEKSTKNKGIRKYWKNNTPLNDNDSEFEVSGEDEIHLREKKVFSRKKPTESSEEDTIIKKRPKHRFKKPYIDTEEDEDLQSTTRKTPRKIFRRKIIIVDPINRLPEYHYDYAEDHVVEIPKNMIPSQSLHAVEKAIDAGSSKRHRHRKKPRRIIYIDSGESIEIIRKSHNKRRPPQDYEEKDDVYYDDITTTHTPENTELKSPTKVRPEYRNDTTTVTSTSSPSQKNEPNTTVATTT